MSQIGALLLPVVQYLLLVILSPIFLLCHVFGVLQPTKKPKKPSVIVITGASSGIGEALALKYAAPGVTLGLTGRNEKRLEAVTAGCRDKGADVIQGILDVTDKDGMEKWLLGIYRDTPIDLVIANAGVTEEMTGTARDISKAAPQLFDVNVNGVFNTILPLVTPMKERGRGQIVLMSSLAGLNAIPASTSYAATKAAIKSFGTGLRAMLHRDGIFVNVVCPGYVKSPLTDAQKFHMPFMVKLDSAVETIVSGVANDDPLIAFPWTLHTLVYLLSAIPDPIRDFISRNRLSGTLDYFKPRRGSKKQ